MNIDDFINDNSEQQFKVNVGNSLLRLLEVTTRNQRYLRTILQTQIEIKSLLKGKTESDFDDEFYDRVYDIEKKIWENAQIDYHKLLDNVLDS